VRLPTDNFTEPGDAKFYIMGRLEGGKPESSAQGRAAGESPTASAAGGTDGNFGHQLD
jgi:hypothetical protein